jgi:hypothetical protein
MANLDQADYNPSLRYDAEDSTTWTTTGNTDTVTDVNVKATSIIVIMHTSAYEGNWYVTPAAGSFTVTSSDVETATDTTYKYLIL